MNKIKFFLLGLLFFTQTFAYSAIYVTPNNAGSLGHITNVTGLSNATPNFYYITQYSQAPATVPTPTAYPAGGPGVLSDGTRYFLDTFPIFQEPLNPQAIIEVNFSTSANASYTIPSGSVAVAVITTTSGGNTPLPIITVNGAECTGLPCIGKPVAGINTYYSAVQYTPGTTLRLGFYASDACLLNAASSSFCTGQRMKKASAAESPTLGLTFNLYSIQLTSGVNTQITSSLLTTSLDTAYPVLFNFVAGTGTLGCPSSLSGLADLYFPGESSIYFNDAGNGSSIIRGLYVPSVYAPVANIIPLFSLNPTLIDFSEATYQTSNVIGNNGNNTVQVGSGKTIGPLINGRPYNMSFLVQDATGMIIPPQAPTIGCTLQGVQSSEIEGFFDDVSGCATIQDITKQGPKGPKTPDLSLSALFLGLGLVWFYKRKRRLFF